MIKRIKVFIFVFVILGLVVSCSDQDGTVISMLGLAEESFTQKDLEVMDMIESEYINKDDEKTVFTGVPILDILTDHNTGDFAAVIIIASDGYSAEVTSRELEDCSGCILAFSEDDGWRAVMPGFSGKFQIKNVVELKVE